MSSFIDTFNALVLTADAMHIEATNVTTEIPETPSYIHRRYSHMKELYAEARSSQHMPLLRALGGAALIGLFWSPFDEPIITNIGSRITETIDNPLLSGVLATTGMMAFNFIENSASGALLNVSPIESSKDSQDTQVPEKRKGIRERLNRYRPTFRWGTGGDVIEKSMASEPIEPSYPLKSAGMLACANVIFYGPYAFLAERIPALQKESVATFLGLYVAGVLKQSPTLDEVLQGSPADFSE